MKFKVILLVCAIAACAVTVEAKSNKRQPVVPQQVDTLVMESKNLPSAMKTIVVLPESYFAKGDTVHYPVVYLLNGYGGSCINWPSEIEPRLDSIASHYGMIFVCPSGMNSWYWDSPEHPEMKMETFITTELVPAIDSLYRTNASATKRAIMGLSMGGHGAMWLAMRHPDIFSAAGSTSGGVDATSFPEKWSKKNWLGDYKANPELWAAHSVINLVPDLKPGQLALIVDCGYDDFFFTDNNRFHQALMKHGIDHDFIVRPGEHNRPYWKKSLPYQLQFFSTYFNKH